MVSISNGSQQSVTEITDHIAIIERRVASALTGATQSRDELKIVAVSKGQPASAIAAAYDGGMRNFGENYVDEALPKIQALKHLNICWHFIGRIQSNKTRPIAENFDWVHTIDRPRVARRLSAQRPHYADPLNVLIQLNLAEEPQKGGVAAASVEAMVEEIGGLPRLVLRGLMTMPPAGLDDAQAAAHFGSVAAIAQLHSTGVRPLDVLSMGMSRDFELAIEHGSTCIRIGTAIFGERAHGHT
jgi:pyridoxal phosphate enzyme (YggS family)